MTIPTRSGLKIPVLLSSVQVDLGGEPRVVTIARDITVLKEQEQKLQSSEAMLREIFDSSVDNIALTDLADGTIINVNHELVRSLGLAKDEIVGKRFAQLKVWDSAEHLELFTATLLERREVRNFETTFRTAGGSTFPALISAVVLETRRPPMRALDRARYHRPRGGAPAGAGRVEGQDRIPVQHVARNSHADERDPRHGRPYRRERSQFRAAALPRYHHQQRQRPARADQQHPRPRAGRERTDEPRGG